MAVTAPGPPKKALQFPVVRAQGVEQAAGTESGGGGGSSFYLTPSIYSAGVIYQCNDDNLLLFL